MASRSGSFSFAVPSGAAVGSQSRQLVYGGEGTVYRVFNSSDRADFQHNQLQLTNNRTGGAYQTVLPAEVQVLFPTMSIDVAIGTSDEDPLVPSGLRVQNGVVPGKAVEIQGSFDLVRSASGGLVEGRKAGRFNLPGRVPDAFFPVLLADLRFTDDIVLYRVYNTGDVPFEIFVALNKSAAKARTVDVGPRQSVDVQVAVPGAPVNARRIFVARKAAGAPVKGVFEMIS